MILKLKAKHFLKTSYSDASNCAMCKALKDVFPNHFPLEIVDAIRLLDKPVGEYFDEDNFPLSDLPMKYYHESYSLDHFTDDRRKAAQYNFDETIIREIEIIGLEEPAVELSTITVDQLLQEPVKA